MSPDAALAVTVAGEVPVPVPVPVPMPDDPEPDPPDDGVAVAAVGAVPLPELVATPVAAAPVPVTDVLIPMPLPCVGPRGEPLETTSPPLTPEEADEAADWLADPVPLPEPVADADAEELEATLEQERSKSGVVDRGFPPVMPKLGLGVALSVSSSVNHHVLTLPKLGHPTASQYVLALATFG